MKLKAVLHEGCPVALVAALESQEFRQKVMQNVLREHLRVVSFGPAEFYIQKCDFACASEPMCEVRLSGVSVNKKRSTEDFRKSLEALETLYMEQIKKHFTTAAPCQLFVAMMLDQPPFGENSSLLERDPVFVPDSTNRRDHD